MNTVSASEPVRMMLVDESTEHADRLTTYLRNSGVALYPIPVRNLDEFAEQLQVSPPPDLIVVSLANAELKLAEIVPTIPRDMQDIPIVAVPDRLDEEEITAALKAGADTIAPSTRQDLFAIAIVRIYRMLLLRRSLAQAETARHEAEKRSDILLESSRDPIAFIHEGMYIHANSAYLEIFGYRNFADLEGMSILNMIAPEAIADFKVVLKNLSVGTMPPGNTLDIKAQHADGSPFAATMEFGMVSYEGEPCLQVILRQQQVDAKLAREIDLLRQVEAATGIYLRQYATAEFDKRIADEVPELALMLIGPDRVNDKLDKVGLAEVDPLLGSMADVIRGALEKENQFTFRAYDHIVGVLLSGRNTDALLELGKSVCRAFETHIFEAGKQSFKITASVGATTIDKTAANASLQIALNQTLVALRNAQNAGGNRVEMVSPRRDALSDQQALLLGSLQDAIEGNRFALYFQPIVSLRGADGEFGETLVRLPTGTDELTPDAFFGVAAENGLLAQIDRHVITATLKHLAACERAGRSVTAFVKLSAPSVEDLSLVPWLAKLLKAAQLRSSALVLQVPESHAASHLKPMRIFIAGLKKLHCALALDRFGGSAESFRLLEQLDASYLRIKDVRTASLQTDKEAQESIKQFCEQANELGKLTIAESVKDAANMQALFMAGVDFVQGDFVALPERIVAPEPGAGAHP